jgi:serine protease Do
MSHPEFLRRVTATLLAMSAGALLTIILYAAVDSRRSMVYAQDNASLPYAAVPNAAVNRGSLAAADLSSAFREVAFAMRPCVVSIQTRAVEKVQPRGPFRGLPREFEQFFGDQMRPKRRESKGMGSGVIVRADGYILTNNHVVEGADELSVEMFNGEVIDGKIVGTDSATDLAVIKIDRQGLQAIGIGDSDKIEVGDWVLAIGSPFGLNQSVTAGIISAKNRVQQIIEDGKGFEDFLQTDAAINPGNSGGPLVNLQGQLVGINTAILSRSGGNSGIGFAIPVSMALPVLQSIIETGEVHRGFLGAKVIDVEPSLVQKFGIKVNQGALIFEVLTDRPAAKAGLQTGDVVTSIAGTPCVSGSQLKTYVASRRPGESFQVGVNRGGQTFAATIQLDERTDEAMSAFGAGQVLDANVVPVTPTTARQYGYADDQTGLIIVGVSDDSKAGQMGFQVGDVIESAAGIELEAASQFNAILEEVRASGKPCPTVVRRGRNRIMVPLE